MKKLLFIFCLLPLVVGAQTPITQPFNPLMPKPVDNRTGRWNGTAWVPYTTTSAANDSINSAYRHRGLTVMIGTPSNFTEYWYHNGVANGDLALKFSGGGGGAGTVTSVAVTVPSGFSVSGSPITTSGTFAITAPGNATTQYINGAGGASLVSNLPISTATQTALDLKANLASPALTGTPTAPTAVGGTNTTQIATTAHVFAERSNAATLTAKTISGGSNTLTNINGGSLTDNTVPVAKMQASGSLTSTTYLRGDGTWSVPSGAGTVNDYDSYYYNASDLMLTRSTADNIVLVRTPGSTTVTVTVPGLNYSSGYFTSGFNWYGATGISAQVMPSGSAIYMDLSVPFTRACTYTASAGTIKNDDHKAIIIENINGTLVSPYPTIQDEINKAEDRLLVSQRHTTYTVCASGCDFTTVDLAYAYVSGLATGHGIIDVYLKNGYHWTAGLGMIDSVNLIGETRDSTMLRCIGTAAATDVSTIQSMGTGLSTISNLTLIHHSDSSKYNIHADNYIYPYNATVQNVKMITIPGGPWTDDIGSGLWAGQRLTLINDTGNFYLHGSSSYAVRDTTKHWEYSMYGCEGKFYFTDYLEYSPNKMTIVGNHFDTLHLSAISDQYYPNPGNRLANRGYKPPYTRIDHWANVIQGYLVEPLADTMLQFLNPFDAEMATGGGGGAYVELSPSAPQTAAAELIGSVVIGNNGTNAVYTSGLLELNGNGTTSFPGSVNAGLKLKGDAGSIYWEGAIYGTVIYQSGAALYMIATAFAALDHHVTNWNFSTNAQFMGSSATAPAVSAKLELVSTTQGFLMPRMTAAQASAIASPATGLLLFVTNTDATFTAVGWWGYNGSAWTQLGSYLFLFCLLFRRKTNRKPRSMKLILTIALVAFSFAASAQTVKDSAYLTHASAMCYAGNFYTQVGKSDSAVWAYRQAERLLIKANTTYRKLAKTDPARYGDSLVTTQVGFRQVYKYYIKDQAKSDRYRKTEDSLKGYFRKP